MSLLLKIATAIEKADKSYFFEDYAKQALAVLDHLKDAGYAIVLRDVTTEMTEAGMSSILPGKIKPEKLVESIWQGMLRAAEKR